MTLRRLALTGFGAFRDVAFNPSGAIAEALREQPPDGWRVASAVLPVTFEGAPAAIDQLLSSTVEPFDLLLGLGVHPGRLFRLERRARAPQPSQPNDGREPMARTTALDVNGLAFSLSQAGGGAVMVSNDAGQYVCECAYHHLLVRAADLNIPALFLHVPRQDAIDHTVQTRIVRRWLSSHVFAPLVP